MTSSNPKENPRAARNRKPNTRKMPIFPSQKLHVRASKITGSISRLSDVAQMSRVAKLPLSDVIPSCEFKTLEFRPSAEEESEAIPRCSRNVCCLVYKRWQEGFKFASVVDFTAEVLHRYLQQHSIPVNHMYMNN